MSKLVCTGSVLQCTFGMAPVPLTVIDPTRPKVENKPIANIMDNKPFMNIPPFGMCQSMSNPQVAAATAAAFGVLTPVPCVPVIAAPWSPGGTAKVSNMPVLLENSKCMCNWGGQISINNPGNAAQADAK